jgi:hypothetical protein
MKSQAISVEPNTFNFEFSIGTLVTRQDEYDQMLATFETAGFTEKNCEFLFVDNRNGNRADAFQGLNWLLCASSGQYIILCHQDVRLEFDNIDILRQRIAEIELQDPQWAILGNAGGDDNFKRLTKRISDPSRDNQRKGSFPARVMSLDENFLVLKRTANLGFSADCKGFHFYGTDLCVLAKIRGYHAYVIDFHLRHLSGGTIDQRFFDARTDFIKKYQQALSARFIRTTVARLYLGSNRFAMCLFNQKWFAWMKKKWDGI